MNGKRKWILNKSFARKGSCVLNRIWCPRLIKHIANVSCFLRTSKSASLEFIQNHLSKGVEKCLSIQRCSHIYVGPWSLNSATRVQIPSCVKSWMTALGKLSTLYHSLPGGLLLDYALLRRSPSTVVYINQFVILK